MATPITLLTSGGSTDNVTDYSTVSVTPTAGKLYGFAALVSGTNPAPDFTVSGLGLTWELACATTFVARGMKLYVAKGTPTAGAMTITSLGAAYTGAAWVLVEIDADLSGANALAALAQTKAARGTATAGPPLSLAFDTAITAGNGTFAAVGLSVAETITPGTGWTGLGATVTVTTPTSAIQGMKAETAVQNIEATWTTADTALVTGIEIKAAATDTTPPSVPTGLDVTADSPTQVTVAWTASTDNVGVASYRVRRDGVDLAGATAVTTTSHVDTTVSPATTYSYTVSAVDAAGNRSAESSALSVTTPAALNKLILNGTVWTGVYVGSTAIDRFYLNGVLYEMNTAAVPPSPPSPPPGGGGSSSAGILLSPAEIAALPTTGTGWDAIAARVATPYGGAYALGVRDDSNKDVLAHALYGARLGDVQAKTFVRDKISAMMAAGRDVNDVLATLRNLQAYIISADLIDLATFDATLDGQFRTWLDAEIRFVYSGGGGGGSVISTHNAKPNNFGTHAGSGRIAAALYLGDTVEYDKARDVWYGWVTGDTAYVPSGYKWSTTNWHEPLASRLGINALGATRDAHPFDGIIPEDMRRQGEYTGVWPPPTGTYDNYIHGATDGASLAFWMMGRKGETCWAWADNAMLRQMQWKHNNSQPPYSGFRWQLRVIEKAYGVTFPNHDPAGTSTNFGYADWWAQ